MHITKESNPTYYHKLAEARRASVIAAAILVYNTEQWIAEQEKECVDKLAAHEKRKADVALLTTTDDRQNDTLTDLQTSIVRDEETLLVSHAEIAENIAKLKAMLATFKEQIKSYNAPSTRSTYISGRPDHPRDLVLIDDKHLKDWYKELNCSVYGTDFYAALHEESYGSRKYSKTAASICAVLALAFYITAIAALNAYFLIPFIICYLGIMAADLGMGPDHIESAEPLVAGDKLESIFSEGPSAIETIQLEQEIVEEAIDVNEHTPLLTNPQQAETSTQNKWYSFLPGFGANEETQAAVEMQTFARN